MYVEFVYWKNVQMNPPGTAAVLISLFKKVSPPVRLRQSSDTIGRFTHPVLTEVQTWTVTVASWNQLNVIKNIEGSNCARTGPGLMGVADAKLQRAARAIARRALELNIRVISE